MLLTARTADRAAQKLWLLVSLRRQAVADRALTAARRHVRSRLGGADFAGSRLRPLETFRPVAIHSMLCTFRPVTAILTFATIEPFTAVGTFTAVGPFIAIRPVATIKPVHSFLAVAPVIAATIALE
jgi:hypothetical protein